MRSRRGDCPPETSHIRSTNSFTGARGASDRYNTIRHAKSKPVSTPGGGRMICSRSASVTGPITTSIPHANLESADDRPPQLGAGGPELAIVDRTAANTARMPTVSSRMISGCPALRGVATTSWYAWRSIVANRYDRPPRGRRNAYERSDARRGSIAAGIP
jgi:hypothetical protein